MLANYSELLTEIANHLNRDNLGTSLNTFVRLFESYANRNLKTRNNDVEQTVTLNAGTRYAALPSNVVDIISVRIGDEELKPIDYSEYANIIASTEKPLYYAVFNNGLNFDSTADTTYTVTVRAYKRLDLATDLTNWLLTNYPEAYLYGSLVAAQGFIGDDERFPIWQGLLEKSVEEINNNENRNRRPILKTELSAFNRNYAYIR